MAVVTNSTYQVTPDQRSIFTPDPLNTQSKTKPSNGHKPIRLKTIPLRGGDK